MIWFLTFGKNGSAGMPAVPATILMSVSNPYFIEPRPIRVSPTDSGMGGDLSPPIGGGHMGGDKGPMGGDLRVIRDKIWRVLK